MAHAEKTGCAFVEDDPGLDRSAALRDEDAVDAIGAPVRLIDALAFGPGCLRARLLKWLSRNLIVNRREMRGNGDDDAACVALVHSAGASRAPLNVKQHQEFLGRVWRKPAELDPFRRLSSLDRGRSLAQCLAQVFQVEMTQVRGGRVVRESSAFV